MFYKYIIITLNHINDNKQRKNKFPNKEKIFNFFFEYFSKMTKIEIMLISKECHKNNDIHYHIGIKTSGINNRYYFTDLRKKLPEFDGRSINVTHRKGFNVIAEYLLKEDTKPFLYNITLEEVQDLADSVKKKKSPEFIIKKLKEKQTWEDVVNDPLFSQKLLHNFNSLKNLYNDLHFIKEDFVPVVNKIKNNKVSKNNIKFIEDFLLKATHYEKDVICWLLKNLFYTRSFRQDQLLIIGESQTGKTTFIKKVIYDLNLSVYEPTSEDFSEYLDNKYDLIFIDEFNYKNFSREFLLKLLDGSTLHYTGKYKEVKIKRNNLPIILICNPTELPDLSDKRWDALKKRLNITIFNNIKNKNNKNLFNNISFKDLFVYLLNNNNNITINIINNNVQIYN